MSNPLLTVEELLMGRVKMSDLSEQDQKNVKETVRRINLLFEGFVWPHKKKVNDGYRRPQDKPKNGASMSTHFSGLAVDLDDELAGEVWKYVFENRKRMKEIGVWAEHPNWTHSSGGTWMHLQIKAPKSGKRFYVPSSQPDPNPKFWDGKYESNLDGRENSYE